MKSNTAFCYVCRMFADELIDEVWTKKGFLNWQKLNEKLKKHAKTKRHLVSVTKMSGYLAYKKSGSVMVKQCSGYKEQVAKNRAYIGNFKELCKLLSNYQPHFKNKFDETTNYTSWSIQDQLIKLCAEDIRETIIKEIEKIGFFALICDGVSSIHKFDFIIVLHILNEVLSIIYVLSNQLQSKFATLGTSSNIIQSVISTFENQRNEDSFFKLWEQIKEFALLNQITLDLSHSGTKSKRKRQEPRESMNV
ncbi:hypothetical protein QTP88_022963 [Uroleucon formosanum]